jgi:hypothetical protein
MMVCSPEWNGCKDVSFEDEDEDLDETSEKNKIK